MRVPRKPLKDAVRATLLVTASLAAISASSSPQPLKVGVGRIVPVAYFDEQEKAVGFAVDVLNEAARREGVSLEWIRLAKGVSHDIQSGTIDLLSAGMATAQRKERFYVSEPWWSQELALLTRADHKQPIRRLGIQQVYVEFARPHFDPTTFVIDPSNTSQAAALEAKGVCKGTLDGALIAHGELHDLFLNRPEECNGVCLQSADTAITYGLSIISRKSDRAVAERLRKRIDDLTLDGTLLRFAAAHPPISISGAVHLQERLRHRYDHRIWLAAGCTVVVVIAFLVWFVWDRHRDLIRMKESQARILELNRDLDNSVKELQSLLGEKSLLLREVQHRVKNNLQVISSIASLHAHQAGSDAVTQAMLTMSDRVKSMALIHERLCFSGVLAEINFAEYVNTLVPRLIQSHAAAPEAIQVHTDVDAVLRLDEAMPCGVILNELLTNALKYAFSPSQFGDIWITFREKDREFLLEVRDNGKGLPPDFSPERSHSLGLQIVADLAAQLEGDFLWGNDNGAVLCVRFSRQADRNDTASPDSHCASGETNGISGSRQSQTIVQ